MTDGIDYFSKGHPLARVRTHFAWRAREAMLQNFLNRLEPSENCQILDVGVTPDTSLPESNHFEQRYPWPNKITATSIEPIDNLKKIFPRVNFQQVQPGALPYKDRNFHSCFSSAVIEHVGDRRAQITFLKELCRVSDRFFITTPNRWFPIDFHTITPLLHWLPQQQHQRLLRLMGKDFWANTSNLNLLGANDLHQICAEACPDFNCTVESVKLLGWPSNLIAWGIRR